MQYAGTKFRKDNGNECGKFAPSAFKYIITKYQRLKTALWESAVITV